MFLLEECPWCKNGDLYVEEDLYGKFATCMQCGYSKDFIDGKIVHAVEIPEIKTKGAWHIKTDPESGGELYSSPLNFLIYYKL